MRQLCGSSHTCAADDTERGSHSDVSLCDGGILLSVACSHDGSYFLRCAKVTTVFQRVVCTRFCLRLRSGHAAVRSCRSRRCRLSRRDAGRALPLKGLPPRRNRCVRRSNSLRSAATAGCVSALPSRTWGPKVPIQIRKALRVIADNRVEIQRLRIRQVRVWDRGWDRRPVGRQEPPIGRGIVTRVEIVVARLGVALLPRPFVVLRARVRHVAFRAVGVKVRVIAEHCATRPTTTRPKPQSLIQMQRCSIAMRSRNQPPSRGSNSTMQQIGSYRIGS